MASQDHRHLDGWEKAPLELPWLDFSLGSCSWGGDAPGGGHPPSPMVEMSPGKQAGGSRHCPHQWSSSIPLLRDEGKGRGPCQPHLSRAGDVCG